jgi:pyridoxamine 5'-phosphate oxidase
MPNDAESIAGLRRNYEKFALNEADVAADPIEQFGRWFEDAKAANVIEPNAMTLATADATGAPSARIVLLKNFDGTGFNFYTNKSSPKGQAIKANPRACLVFWWPPLERQVRIDGTITDVSHEEAEAYFHSRPVASQLGAWASRQSRVLESREPLERSYAEYAAKYAGKQVPMPDFWGGYHLNPTSIEFWQGRPSRLHDRLRYVRVEGKWKIERLSP